MARRLPPPHLALTCPALPCLALPCPDLPGQAGEMQVHADLKGP